MVKTMSEEANKHRDRSSKDAHRHLGGTQVQRFVRSLDFYRVDNRLPRSFDRLLEKLDDKSSRN
jgi:hypothetical protein